MDDAEHLVLRLYREAATACGDDVHAVDRYVARRVSELSEEEQRRFRSVGERVLGFHAPAARPEHSH